jgi:hypothetical protein
MENSQPTMITTSTQQEEAPFVFIPTPEELAEMEAVYQAWLNGTDQTDQILSTSYSYDGYDGYDNA